MIILGVVLFVIGLLFAIPLLVIAGLVLGGVGLLLILIGATGHAIGGRRHWY